MIVCHSPRVMGDGMGVSATTLYTEVAEEEVMIKVCTDYLVEYGINSSLQNMEVRPRTQKEGGQVGDSEIRRLGKDSRNTMQVTMKIFLHEHLA